MVAMYDRRVPSLRGPNNSINTGLKVTIIGYLAPMFAIGVNEMWHFWFVEEIFSVPNHWVFNMGVVLAFMLVGGFDSPPTTEDIVILVVVAVGMVAAAMLACMVPTRRALAVQPMDALRE